jgi:hypothetical protein
MRSAVYYSSTREQLFEQAIAHAETAFPGRLRQELEHLVSGAEQLAGLIVRSAASDWVLWMDPWVYERRHPETFAAGRGLFTWRCETIVGAIRYAVSRGEFGSADADRLVQEHPRHTRDQYVATSLTVASAERGRDLATLRHAAGRFLAADPAGCSR